MKAGETLNIVQKLNLTKPYDVVRFRLSNGINTITKDLTEDSGGVFVIPLYQEDTHKLEGRVSIEAEVDFEDKSVRYSNFNDIYLNKTLGYDPVENNQPSNDDGIDLIMESIEQGVAVVISPESAEELITRVTELFQDTKDIAQSVRDDADRGEFDGYSPQVTVKTETPSTYVLHIKDADHEYDTPNLQGQGGEGSLEVGDGLKREGNVVSVDLNDDTYNLAKFNNRTHALEVEAHDVGFNETVRESLTNDSFNYQLASKDYVDGLMSGATKWEFVSQLPTENIDIHTIYFVPKESAETDNIYDEWVYAIQSRNPDVYDWELLGTTEVDLSNYQTLISASNKVNADYIDDSESTNKFTNATEKQTWNGKQDTLTAGSNISISNNEISATDTTYSAGTGLSLSGGAFSVDNPVPSGTSSDYGKYLKNNNGTLEWASVSAGGGGLTPTNTAPTTSTSGSIGDQLLLTTRPARIYTLVAIEDNEYIWVVTSGENVVFEEIPPTPPEPGVDAELEVKRIKATNAGVTRGAYTPYFDYTAIDNVGETTAYYKIVATCSEGYYVRSNTSSDQAVVGTYPADGSVSTPNAERTEASNKAPYNNNKYIYIGVGINPYRTITEDEIDTILENANVQIKVYNDQDQEVAKYKMVNKVVD